MAISRPTLSYTAGALLLAAGAACHDEPQVTACGLAMRNGNVQLHSTFGWPSQIIEVPAGQMVDSLNTGRWVHKCKWVEQPKRG